MLEPARENLKELEEDGAIVKKDEPTPWVLPLVVIDWGKVNDKRKDTSPSKDDIWICIDPRDLDQIKRWNVPSIQWLP